MSGRGPDASHPRPNLRAPLLRQLSDVPSNMGHSPSGRSLFLDSPSALLEGLRCFTAFGPLSLSKWNAKKLNDQRT